MIAELIESVVPDGFRRPAFRVDLTCAAGGELRGVHARRSGAFEQLSARVPAQPRIFELFQLFAGRFGFCLAMKISPAVWTGR